MKVFLKVLKVIGIIVATLVVIILALRAYNYFTYSKYKEVDKTSIYSDPTNLDLYPKDIPGVEVKHIEGDYLNGFHLKPQEKTKKGVIVTFGGSDGSTAYYEALVFAQQGYEVLSLFSFGMPNQQAMLSKVPIDFFDEVLAYIKENVSEPVPLTLYGGSKGAELSLNLAKYYPEVDHVILVAPSAYNFNGLDYQIVASSWTYKGEELPYVSTMQANFFNYLGFLVGMVTDAPTSYETLYRTAVENTSDIADKTILQEPIDADILVFAGGSDRMWPSAQMAEVIKATQGDRAEVHIYENAGHVFAGDGYMGSEFGVLALGGSEEANTAAFEDYQKILMERLAEWHK